MNAYGVIRWRVAAEDMRVNMGVQADESGSGRELRKWREPVVCGVELMDDVRADGVFGGERVDG